MALTLTYAPDTITINVVSAPSPVTVKVSASGPGPAGPPGTGKEWVAITSAAYDALSEGERNDASKVYDITDFTW